MRKEADPAAQNSFFTTSQWGSLFNQYCNHTSVQ